VVDDPEMIKKLEIVREDNVHFGVRQGLLRHSAAVKRPHTEGEPNGRHG
jgi:hypothetical protein